MKIQYVTILPEQAGQRIDNFLLRQFRAVPKSRVYKAIRKAEVRVNKHRVQATHRLLAGDLVRYPELRMGATRTPERPLADNLLQQASGCILYEDEQLIIAHKPAGLAVHAGTHQCYGLIDMFRQALPHYPFLELAHRLDRKTSGCLLIAKQRKVLLALQSAFSQRRIKKMYFAILVGRLANDHYHVDQPLMVSSTNNCRQKTIAAIDGRVAITDFKVVHRMSDATLVAAYPQTGRTHQIRAHAAIIGHPIIGDERYGDREFNKKQSSIWGNRLYLHAASYELDAIDDLNLQGICVPVNQAWRETVNKLTAHHESANHHASDLC